MHYGILTNLYQLVNFSIPWTDFNISVSPNFLWTSFIILLILSLINGLNKILECVHSQFLWQSCVEVFENCTLTLQHSCLTLLLYNICILNEFLSQIFAWLMFEWKNVKPFGTLGPLKNKTKQKP